MELTQDSMARTSLVQWSGCRAETGGNCIASKTVAISGPVSQGLPTIIWKTAPVSMDAAAILRERSKCGNFLDDIRVPDRDVQMKIIGYIGGLVR